MLAFFLGESALRGLYLAILGGFTLALGIAAFIFWPDRALYTLDPHGLRAAYFVPTSATHVMLEVIVQSGEMDNTGTQGIPHYADHLAWLAAIGANNRLTGRQTEAFTTPAATSYVIAVPVEKADQALRTLAGVLAPLPPENAFMRRERDIVMREYDFRFVDVPWASAFESLNAASFVGDPRARSLIGTRDEIASFTVDQARSWHSATHHAANTVLLISGPISRRQAGALVAQAFGGAKLQAGTMAQSTPAKPIDLVMGPIETLLRPRNDARFSYPLINRQTIVALDHPLEFAAQTAQLSLFYDIVDSTLPGSYAKPLRFDAKIAQGYDLQITALTDRHYALSFWDARPDAGVSLQVLNAAIDNAIRAGEIPQATFDRVKQRWLKRVLEEDAEDQTLDLARSAIHRRLPPVDADAYRAAAHAITLADMNRLSYAFRGESRTVVDMISPQPSP